MNSKFVLIYCIFAKSVSVGLSSAKLVSNYWILARLCSVALISLRSVYIFSLFIGYVFSYSNLVNEVTSFYFTVIDSGSF